MEETLIALLPWLVLFGLMYFFMIRPQRQRQQERQEMLQELKTGDKVITVGGIHGQLTQVGEEEITLRITDDVEIQMSKQGVETRRE